MDLLRDFRRGAVAVHVLYHATEIEVHGAWMSEELARHGYRISPGTLYPLLHRLEDARLIAGRDEVVNGRVLRRYRATARGERALAGLRLVIAELAAEIAAPSARRTPTPRSRKR
jgi:DNA-binding PadR family transcriptional regulator